MEWNEAMEDNRQVLKRIVALLYAFAGLAERLCDRPRPVRALVFWILRFAETVARDFVMDTALDQGASVPPDLFTIPALHAGDGPADALRLAESFRALAIMLDRLADENPGRGDMRIITFGLTLAACAARCHLPPGLSAGLCLAAPGFAVERRDSS